MQIHSLRTFYWVTRLNSFRKAAKVLNISQPTVSSRIRGLEEELGVTLLSRDQNLALTVQGEELLEYARTVLRLTEDLSFHRSADARDSRLRLGANGPVAATWLMPLVERMERKFPDLRVEIEVNQSATLLRHMGSGQLDIAFASSESQDSSLKYIPLGSFDMVWIAAPGLFQGCLSDDDLGRSPIIGYSWDSPIHGSTHRPAFGLGRHRRFTQSDSLFMMIRMAVEGAGLALVPRAAITRELSNRQLEVIEVDNTPTRLPLFCARPRNAANALITMAAQYAQEAMNSLPQH
ncbi:LysR family transcriptional regulator [Tritonibacter mobilis]|uniref:LysR family transcriptional regulator n=1 Tax=Tritonibacter mobilis TaxID=379347 RepID=UPI000806D847|nr:LysR family transcriptional regulator [Tritonibacter mobilis]GLP88560.1 LysR family transcriptional regulator [Tritonibacter mobilis]SDX82813.1 DNA-binding transcriptional regulator, LysR family [Tritonibacter mobilis]